MRDSSEEQLARWLEREPGFDLPAQAFTPPHFPSAEERVPRVGDEVALYLKDDRKLAYPVYLRLTKRDPCGRMVGVVSKSNSLEVKGDKGVARGKEIEFKERNIVILRRL